MTAETPLPEEIVARLGEILPPERFADCLASFSAAPATAFRVNPLRATVDEVACELRAAGFELRPLSWNPDAFVVPHEQRADLTASAAHAEGRVYVQNPSSMIPPLVLAPEPGDHVLDLTAAPGSKTLQLAAMMGGGERLVAVEKVRGRFFRLRANLAAHGANDVRTVLTDGAGFWRRNEAAFDRVLLDAPCSSEARFTTRDPRSFRYWSRRKVRDTSRKQKRLLFSAIQCLRPGGTLVYSTCSFSPEENEGVVHKLLRRFAGELHVSPVELPLANVQPGLTTWRGRDLHPDLAGAARILPDGVMEGFFVCCLRREPTGRSR